MCEEKLEVMGIVSIFKYFYCKEKEKWAILGIKFTMENRKREIVCFGFFFFF